MLRLAQTRGHGQAEPLQSLTLTGASGQTVSVCDGAGREYARLPITGGEAMFTVGGTLGTHTVVVWDGAAEAAERLTFFVDARTQLDDGGRGRELFDLLVTGMRVHSADYVETVVWRGRAYTCFVHWLLDHLHTAKGMQYFSPAAADLAELLRDSQREDGMIWSFVRNDDGPGYFDTAYGPFGYVKRDGNTLFVRQPAENHCEYLYVNLIHLCWKATGDAAWMAGMLESARRALDYSVTDRSRWSEEFGLLKRGYTIDSWDFQVQDSHSPSLGLGNDMLIDPDRTKFGIFYGDNTGYVQACEQLTELLERAGQAEEAEKYRRRGEEIRDRLDILVWNGEFFTHRIEEDPNLHRDLGVDPLAQISLSNCYSVNRGLTHGQCRAILETYQDLQNALPPGSPGEWYAVYPPFEKGFGDHAGKWIYMNGGVAGHAAGELARGAFEHGFEAYGADILSRLLDLGQAHGGRLWFSYTGALPPSSPSPHFIPLSLAETANMDLTTEGGPDAHTWMDETQPGNDLRGLPIGRQTFAGIPFEIADPAVNRQCAALAVSARPGFSVQAEVRVNASAAAVYLLHTAASIGNAGVAGAVTFVYEDGTEAAQYLLSGRHLTGWWFPHLDTPTAGVAWHGPNPVSADVGVCWAALDNPHPDKRLGCLRFDAPLDGGVYAVLGLTLSDQPHVVAPSLVSLTGADTGGPDNWAAGTAMAALMEGLAGVTDDAAAYRRVRLSPRWAAAGTPSAAVTARYAASDGYVAYTYAHDLEARLLTLALTGSGEEIHCRLLLPNGVQAVLSVTSAGQSLVFEVSVVEESQYAEFTVTLPAPQTVVLQYAVSAL